MARPISRLENQTFGNLKVLELTDQRNHNRTAMWRCVCLVCGTEVIVPSTKLKEGAIRSCGCQEYVRPARTSPGESGFNSMYNNYKQGARVRNLPFELSKEEFKTLTQLNCTYCGQEPSSVIYGSLASKKEYGKYTYNGIDRVDPKVGYILSNCVPCCSACNISKGHRTAQEFLDWISKVHNFSNN